MVNIRDVAKKAQVSPGTVSRVLNQDPTLSINDQTRERIKLVCQELEYQPRKYKSKKSHQSIGIISAISRETETDDVYYRKIREHLSRNAKESEIAVSFMIYLPNVKYNINEIKNVNCLIILGHIQKKIHEDLYQLNNNLIIVDDFYADSKYNSISVDFYTEMKNVLEYVYTLGHQNIAFIGGKNRRLTLENSHEEDGMGDREQAYADWMLDKGLQKYYQPFIGEEWYTKSGYDLTSKLLATSKDKLPSLIIAASDLMAIGALRRLSEENLTVPDDISLCSFDDLETSAFLTPSLTTLRVNIDEMVYWIMACAKKIISNNKSHPTKIIISGTFKIRESLRAL